MQLAQQQTNTTISHLPASRHQVVDYSRFRFRAEVDWVQIHVRTTTRTNFWTVKDRLGEKYALALDADASGAATSFLVKIQNPRNWQEVDLRLERLTHDHKLAENPVVTAIEISFDAYSRQHSRGDLEELVADFYKFSTSIGSANRRISGRGRGNSFAPSDHRQTQCKLANGYMVVAGDHTATQGRPPSQVAFRAYLKEVDEGVPLPESEHRARVEQTLTMNEITSRSLSAWKRHDFTCDSKYFKFRKLKPGLSLLVAVAVHNLPQVGDMGTRKRIGGGGMKKHSPLTIADTRLNAIAYDALRSLTRRMKRVTKTVTRTGVAKISDIRQR